MISRKRTATLIGVFYIIGTVAGVLSLVFLGPFMEDTEYLSNMADNKIKVVSGALCILIMGLALTMVPTLLYPIIKESKPILATGAVIFRGALEAVVYMSQTILWLVLLSVSQNFVAAGINEGQTFQSLGAVLMASDVWIGHTLSIVFSLGALMIYWMLYQSRLIPRWLSIWGIVGGLLYLASPLLGFYGVNLGFLTLPLAIQEMAMALWLIIKGFDPRYIEA